MNKQEILGKLAKAGISVIKEVPVDHGIMIVLDKDRYITSYSNGNYLIQPRDANVIEVIENALRDQVQAGPVATYEEFEREIQAIEKEVLEWRHVLNTEGVWLLIAVLGCWSVTNPIIRTVAMVLVLVVFGWQALSKQKSRLSFPKWISMVEGRVLVEIPDKVRQQSLLYELQILKDLVSSFKSLKQGVIYLLCVAFYMLSFIYFSYSGLLGRS